MFDRIINYYNCKNGKHKFEPVKVSGEKLDDIKAFWKTLFTDNTDYYYIRCANCGFVRTTKIWTYAQLKENEGEIYG